MLSYVLRSYDPAILWIGPLVASSGSCVMFLWCYISTTDSLDPVHSCVLNPYKFSAVYATYQHTLYFYSHRKIHNKCDLNQTATLERQNQSGFTKRHQKISLRVISYYFAFQHLSGAVLPPFCSAFWKNSVHQQHTQKSTIFIMHTVCFEYIWFCHFQCEHTTY